MDAVPLGLAALVEHAGQGRAVSEGALPDGGKALRQLHGGQLPAVVAEGAGAHGRDALLHHDAAHRRHIERPGPRVPLGAAAAAHPLEIAHGAAAADGQRAGGIQQPAQIVAAGAGIVFVVSFLLRLVYCPLAPTTV